MKFVILILISVLFKSTCTSDSITSIKLESRTRGYQEIIEVKQDLELIHMIVSPQRSLNDTMLITSLQWKELVDITNQIPMSEIPNFIAPSHENRTDRALIQTLEVQPYNGNPILSKHYDRGNPPHAIAPLVAKIEAMVAK